MTTMGDIYGWEVWEDDDSDVPSLRVWNVSATTKWGTQWAASFCSEEDAAAYVARKEGVDDADNPA